MSKRTLAKQIAKAQEEKYKAESEKLKADFQNVQRNYDEQMREIDAPNAVICVIPNALRAQKKRKRRRSVSVVVPWWRWKQ